MPKRKTIDHNIPRTDMSRFTEEGLRGVADDLRSGRWPLQRTQISDEMVTGLRAMVHKSGLISFGISYYVGEERPYMHIGSLNKDKDDYLTIEEARHIAKTIKALGAKGINVQDAADKRLIRELKRDGANWRPGK